MKDKHNFSRKMLVEELLELIEAAEDLKLTKVAVHLTYAYYEASAPATVMPEDELAGLSEECVERDSENSQL